MEDIFPGPDRVDRIQLQWAAERPDVDVTPQALIGRLHRLAAALTAELTPVFDRHGLGEGEFDVLAALRRSGAPFELAPGELASHTMVTSGAATKRIDRLVADGLVERRVGEKDARTRIVALTERGRRVIDEAFADHMENEARLVGLLGEADRQALEPILRRWLAAAGAD